MASVVEGPPVSTSITPFPTSDDSSNTTGAGHFHVSNVPCLDDVDFGDVWTGEDGAFLLLDLSLGGKCSCWSGTWGSTSGSDAPGSFIYSR